MKNEIQELLDKYQKWLKDKTKLRELKEWIEITTPYLDRHNDYLQIYVKKTPNGYILTDDGYIIEDLRNSGCDIDTKKRENLLNLILNGFGIKKEKGDALVVNANNENFALQKHNLIQAMLSLNDIFYLAQPFVKSLFLEDVTSWLDLNEVRYIPNVTFTGRSGFPHHFDFAIPQSKKMPERILKVISKPSKDTFQAVAFSWLDTKEVRIINSKAYAIINDSDPNQISRVVDALKAYDVHPVLWSERARFVEIFSN